MTMSMKVKKGDLVQILSGKDRGKQGRVIQANPAERKVIVENLNVVKRHTRPQPIKESSRMGGTQMTPGGVIDKASPLSVSKVMVVCPTCRRPREVVFLWGVGPKDGPAPGRPGVANLRFPMPRPHRLTRR